MRATWRDDVIWPAGIHAGIVTLPTALALGEVRRVSGREMLLALVLGYEVLGKLGTAADGWTAKLPRRPTMIYGGYGPVVVGGRLLKLGLKNMAHALGYAANVGMGVPEGGQTEHYYGLISRGGTLAVQLAEAGGIAYSNETIEGETGLYRSFFGKVPAELPTLIGQLGSDWEILKAAQKRYPGTGQNTVAIELLLGLLKAEKLTAKQVSRVDVFQSAVDDSKERKKEVSSRGPFAKAGEAYSSLPYALALVLLEGKVAGERYENEGIVNDATVAATMQKINLAFENGHDSMRWSRIEVSTTDGRKLTREADNFSFPFPREAWGEWLQKDGKRLLPKGKLRRLEDMVGALEKVEDVSEMLALLAPV
jgi:2-methylcitrate dehydratase PrpD